MFLALVTFYFVIFITAIAFQTLDNRKTLTTAFEHAAEGEGRGRGMGGVGAGTFSSCSFIPCGDFDMPIMCLSAIALAKN